jgi:hypothetical protein
MAFVKHGDARAVKDLAGALEALVTDDVRDLAEAYCFAVYVALCVEINQCVGCRFSAMERPSWLCRAVRNQNRHAIEQASRRWCEKMTQRFSTNAP